MGRLTAHWAILGKPPASLNDYEVIGCSAGAITEGDFRTWLKTFTSGTMEPGALPRVATSYFAADEPWLGLSLQREPDSQDGYHRPYAMTYLVCVRWADAASWVSYRALHDALVKENFAGDAPFELSLPLYDEHRLAAAVNVTARRAAALLLTGWPVCVTGAARLPMDRRLDFLDAVAALLPYGFRHELAVSTWTNSATPHRIRLSFAEVAPTHGAWELPWETCAPADLPRQVLLYERELDRYQGDDLGELMKWLAAFTEPCDFDDESHRAAAIDLLRSRDATQPHTAVVARQELSVEQLLLQCRQSIAQTDERRLGDLIAHLPRRADAQVTEHDRKTYRVLVRENPIRPPEQLDHSVHVRKFFEHLLGLLYPSPMHAADVEEMLVDLGGPDLHRPQLARPLLDAMARIMPTSDPSGKLLIASLLGAGTLDAILDAMSADELLDVAVRARNRKVLDIVMTEAKARAQVADPQVVESITRALLRHRYLIEAIDSNCSAEESIGYYQQVLAMGHRRRLTSADIKEIFREVGSPPPPFQLAIMAESGRGTATALLRALVNGMMRDLNLTGRPLAGRIRAGLDRMTSPGDDDGGRRTYHLHSQALVPTVGKVVIGGTVLVVIALLTAWVMWR